MSMKYSKGKRIEGGGSHPSNLLMEANTCKPEGSMDGKHDQVNQASFSHLNKWFIKIFTNKLLSQGIPGMLIPHHLSSSMAPLKNGYNAIHQGEGVLKTFWNSTWRNKT